MADSNRGRHGLGQERTGVARLDRGHAERHSNGNGHGRSLYQLCGEGTLMVMEHLMGLPTGYITGLGLSTAAQRRLLGNGVAPAQGALAIWEGLNKLD